jgi:hypothetical protein
MRRREQVETVPRKSKKAPVLAKALVVASVAAVSALAAFGLDGERGLLGAAAGGAIALVLCGTSALFLRWARRASGNAILAAMLGSTLASFVLLAAAIIAVARVRREIVVPAALTALAIYLAYRFSEAFEWQSSASRARLAGPGGGDARR